MKLIVLRAFTSGALVAGMLAFTPLAQAQTSGATGTTSGPASAKTSGKWTSHPAANSSNPAAGNASGTSLGGAPGQPAKQGVQAGTAPNKNTSKGTTQ